MYSPDHWEILAEVNSVFCITVVSLIFGRKVASIDGPMNYVRGLLLSLYGMTWATDLISCMLSSTNNGNYISCFLGFLDIAVCFTVSKIVLCLYFIEKLYIISVPKSSRMKCTPYLISVGLLFPLLGLIALLFTNRIILINDHFPFHCTIGYDLPAASAMLAYMFLLQSLFAGMFLKSYLMPNTAQQTAHQASNLRMMSKRNFIAAIISLALTAANFGVMIATQGYERGLVAMSINTLDISIVVCVIHWGKESTLVLHLYQDNQLKSTILLVTTHPSELQVTEKALQRGTGDKPVKLEIKQHQQVVILTEMNTQA
ncbi:hypothetical protein EC973_003971 [Apophysomyces ossiformis]|uniref:Uncharacterized protein n=1 Tax=Apophysomyces ossiformis TaxID=679940 RepID=A0A8H7BGH8_9FUNG|nr:hypothetical protein EC973_003971 [Apophysomyces ossiformis]